jgi:type II secretory pathway pseudopilin PulG
MRIRAGLQKPSRRMTGQSLFEIVLALGIILLLVGGLVVAATISVRNTNVSTGQAEATRYAQQAMEWIRNEKDNDWERFRNRAYDDPGSLYCLNTLSWPLRPGRCGSSSFIPNTQYQREARLVRQDPNTVKVTVSVFWQEAGRRHTTDISSVFTNWK